MSNDTEAKCMWDDSQFVTTSARIENVTGFFAQHLIDQAGLQDYPIAAPLTVFDNACGNGIVTAILHEVMNHRSMDSFEVVSGDIADAMVESTNQRAAKNKWTNTKVLKVDAQDTKLPTCHFTHVLNNFGPMLLPNPSAMMSECNRILRPGGVLGFTTWQKTGWLEDMNAAMATIPGIPTISTVSLTTSPLGTGRWDESEFLRDQLANHGFENISVASVPNTTNFENLDELRAVVKVICTIVKSKCWSQEQHNKFAGPQFDQKVMEWFEERFKKRSLEWHWVALIATGIKI